MNSDVPLTKLNVSDRTKESGSLIISIRKKEMEAVIELLNFVLFRKWYNRNDVVFCNLTTFIGHVDAWLILFD